MSQKQLLEMARRNLAHVKAKTVDQAPDVFRVPVHHYYDEERFQQELDRVFGRLPLVLGFSVELPEPGTYKSVEVSDVPVLLTRDGTGELRAFLNVCSHRGAIVVPEGTGTGKRFVCPYHAWTYDQAGALVGVLDKKDFGEIDRSCLGLTPLACAERAGLIFVWLRPGDHIDIDTFLCGYDELLEHLGLARCHVVGQQSISGPNWKVAYDGYLDFYHLPILHKESFGTSMPNKALYDGWGPHQRVSMPNPAFAAAPEEEWELEHLISGIWTVFPHVSIASFDAGGKFYMISKLYPGPTAEESVTVQSFLTPNAPTDEQREAVSGMMKFLEHVVRDEDYFTGKRIQRAAKTGAKAEFLFGRNEAGGQRFHGFLDALLKTEDADLAGLFGRGR